MLLQNTNDMFFEEPGSLHRLLLSIGNRLTSKRGVFGRAGQDKRMTAVIRICAVWPAYQLTCGPSLTIPTEADRPTR